MANIDFPNAPVDGQVFVAANGQSYTWNASTGAWFLQPGPGPAAAYVGLAPPASPFPGEFWYYNDGSNPAAGQLYVYYDDGTSQQWVPATPINAGSIGAYQVISTQVLSAPAASIIADGLGSYRSIKVL